jgi:colanic acid/amylovoran biosynthesis glycosyltransferase
VTTEGPGRRSDGPRVAVWRDTFAPYSETFIWDELRHHVRYQATVFAYERLNADRFPWDDVVTFDGGSWRGRAERAAFRALAVSPSFARAMRRGRYALVHAHFGTAAVRALPYAALAGVPLVSMFHGGDVSRLFGPASKQPRNWLMAAGGPRVLTRSALVLAASEDLAHQLEAAGCPRDKLRVHTLGVDLTQFRRARAPDDARVHVLMVGRLVEKKGFEDGLRALARAGVEGVRVSILGDGPLRERLQRAARELGLAEMVTFAGALTHAQVRAHMADADVILAPSAVTPTGDRDSGIIVVKEAAASGLPCVGTLHGGLPQIVDDGVTGFLVPERDVEGLADRLGRLFADPGLRERMGAAARAKIAREYDIVARVAELERIYDEVVARGAA